MVAKVNQEYMKEELPMEFHMIESTTFEVPALEIKRTLKQIKAGSFKVAVRVFERISRFFKNRSEHARLAEKSRYNPRYHQERISIERIKDKTHDYTPRIY